MINYSENEKETMPKARWLETSRTAIPKPFRSSSSSFTDAIRSLAKAICHGMNKVKPRNLLSLPCNIYLFMIVHASACDAR